MKNKLTTLILLVSTLCSYAQLKIEACGSPTLNEFKANQSVWFLGGAAANTCATQTATMQLNNGDTLRIGAGYTRTWDFGLNQESAVLILEGTLNFSSQKGINGTIIIKDGGKLIGTSNLRFYSTSTLIIEKGGYIECTGLESQRSFTGEGVLNITSGNFTLNSNSAKAEFINDFNFEGSFAPSGSGEIKLTREFTRTGWHHIGWPTASGANKTLADLTLNGFTFNYAGPQNNGNVYTWDAQTSGWATTSANTSLFGNAFNIYAPAGSSISLTLQYTEFNHTSHGQGYNYHNPGNTPPGNATSWTTAVTDGWNMLYNNFQSYLSLNIINTDPNNPFSGGVSVWDGSQYLVGNGNVGDISTLSPNQAFFVRNANSGTSGNYTIPQNSKIANPASMPSYFKTTNQTTFVLTGQNYTVKTYVAENFNATNLFDGKFDAYYRAGTAPIFNTVGADSTAYSINQMPVLDGQELYASFYHNSNGKAFSIALDTASTPATNHIYLTDIYTGAVTDLTTGAYNFTSNKNAPVQRFKLFFTNSSVGIAEVKNTENLNVWFTGDALQLDENVNLENASVQIFSISGQLVAQGCAQDNIVLNKSGVFVVTITTAQNHVYNVKVIKL